LSLSLTQDEDGILRWRYAEAQRREASDETLKAIHHGPKKDMKSRFQTQQDLADALNVRKSTISKHLKALRGRGLVGASTSPILITEQEIKRLNALGGG
jgi:Mn-dependent DtxR family transcriptional regulator